MNLKSHVRVETPQKYIIRQQSWKLAAQRKIFVPLAAAMLMWANSGVASSVTWDPAGGNTGAGSGNWDTTSTFWWNGSTDVAWAGSGTSPTQEAIFNGPDAAAGTYNITNDAVQIAVTNLQVNANGYTFNGANAIYVGANDALMVAANKTVTFNCPMAGSGTSPFWILGSGATMNVTGNLINGQQVRLAGASGSAYNLTGANMNPSIMFVYDQVNVPSGLLNPSSSFYIGYIQSTIAGLTYPSGTLSVSGSGTVTVNGAIFIIGRSGGTGTLQMSGNSTVTIGTGATSRNLAVDYDSSAGSSGTVNVYGGTLTVGAASQTASAIDFFDTAGSGVGAGATAVLNQTNGTINAFGGILFGPASGSFIGGVAALTNSGGFLYVGARGIALNTVAPPTYYITLSGGTVGAMANWSSSMPMQLATLNGNITFQCADSSTAPWNISLSGALTGAGGFYQTGGGILSLSGANNLPGGMVVSNGTLAVVTGNAMTYGPVTLDGTAGSPTLSARVSNRGQSFTTGALTYRSGSLTADFQYGSLTPSTSVGAVQVSGNVNFTATPSVTVEGTAIPVGTYPLIQYTGAALGTVPNSVVLPIYASGYVTNLTASKTIALVVTSSTYNPAYSWAVGNGNWDTTSFNWKQFGNATNYTDGSAVLFDDTASGTSPINVTVNTTVNPSTITANNVAKQYNIGGTGDIAGSANLLLLGGGTVSISGTNTYSGGTEVSAGRLNINMGWTNNASAIGTGALTLDSGALIDDTGSSDVTLGSGNTETWNGNFGYVGLAHNFNSGSGQITMNAPVSLAVSNNTFTAGANITDNGINYQLTKTGNGALTLSTANNFGGGLVLQSGLLNIGDPGCTGSGVFTINGGSIDNLTGQALQILSPLSYTWGGSFNFVGTTNLDLGYAQVNIPNGLGGITLNVVSNMLSTEGLILNNNTTVTKTGGGTWSMSGVGSSTESLGLFVNGGVVVMSKTGQAITGGNNVGLTVNTGGLVMDGMSFQIHSATAVAIPVNLSGGVYDLNGFDENIDKLNLSNGGTLRNGAAASTSTLHITPGDTAQVSGTNCVFDVTAPDGALVFNGPIGGSGTLVKTGPGQLSLSQTNIYTGGTIIENGTIVLPGVSSISGTGVINLAVTNAALDLSLNTDTNSNPTPILPLANGQTLEGFGVVTGLVQMVSGAALAPGSATTMGTLTVEGVSGSNVLNGVTMMKLNKGALTNDQLVVSGSLFLGGTLALSNLSGSLAPGDSFTLFNAAGEINGAFASLSPPRPNFPAFGLAWNTNNLATTGVLTINSAPVPPPPVFNHAAQSGGVLTMSGTNGLANEPFAVLATTNLALSSSWVPVATNAFDMSGNFSVMLPTTNAPQQFFKLLVQ